MAKAIEVQNSEGGAATQGQSVAEAAAAALREDSVTKSGLSQQQSSEVVGSGIMSPLNQIANNRNRVGGKEDIPDRIISSGSVADKMELGSKLNNKQDSQKPGNGTEAHHVIDNKSQVGGRFNNVVADAARTVTKSIGQGVIDGLGLMITPIQGLLNPARSHESGSETTHEKTILSNSNKPKSVSR